MTPTQPGDRDARNCRCTICGFVLAGEVPAHCPECGARAAMFEETTEAPHGVAHNPFQPHDAADQRGEVLGPGEDGCIEAD
jgi:hypothetical protein